MSYLSFLSDYIYIKNGSNPNLTSLYLYLETLREIAQTGKAQFIIVPEESEYILQTR